MNDDQIFKRLRALELASPYSNGAAEQVENAGVLLAFVTAAAPAAWPPPPPTLAELELAALKKRALEKAVGDKADEELKKAQMKAADPQRPEHTFVDDVLGELRRARGKFPSSNASMTALVEEVGELARAMLSESPHAIYQEAVQVAAMAMRVALEGDPTLDTYRKRQNADGTLHTIARGVRPPPTLYPDGLRYPD